MWAFDFKEKIQRTNVLLFYLPCFSYKHWGSSYFQDFSRTFLMILSYSLNSSEVENVSSFSIYFTSVYIHAWTIVKNFMKNYKIIWYMLDFTLENHFKCETDAQVEAVYLFIFLFRGSLIPACLFADEWRGSRRGHSLPWLWSSDLAQKGERRCNSHNHVMWQSSFWKSPPPVWFRPAAQYWLH